MLTRHDESTGALLPLLMFNRYVPSSAGVVSRRTAVVRHNVETTYVVPGDWPKADGQAWFHDGAPPAAGSDVEYLIDGAQTFEAMLEAMETATKQGHYIFLLGWSCDVDFAMARGKSFLQIVAERAAAGVSVRVLLFKHADSNTGDANEKLNRLRTASTAKPLDVYSSLDDNTKTPISSAVATLAGFPGSHALGAHHHKILLVYGDEGLVAFCGGVDLAPDRLGFYHDVHVRVRGDAAKELLKIAEQRWVDSRDNGNPPTPSTISILSPAAFTPPSRAPYLARVVQTVGNPDTKGIPNTIWPSIQRAIQRASRFIYIEDQYFWSEHLVKELVAAATRVQHITVVIPPGLIGEYPVLKHRTLHKLVTLGGNGVEKKIGIFEHKGDGHDWIHAKLFVFDDEYAIVGSANANNRSYFHDGEASVGIAERAFGAPDGARGGSWFATEANFARRLRIKLWEEHLGLVPDELFDGVGARVHWDVPTPQARVQVYQAIDMNAQGKLKDMYAKEVDEWAKGGWRGPMPVMPWTRAPWYEAPYEDWYPTALPWGASDQPPYYFDKSSAKESLKQNWLPSIADPTTSEGAPIMKQRL